MTAGEMREQKIRLRVELEEAEERLNQLREEAIRQADLVLEFGTWLRNSPERYIYRDPVGELHGLPAKPLADKYIDALNWQQAVQTAHEIRKETAKIAELKFVLERL
jgi:hypothetical protein